MAEGNGSVKKNVLEFRLEHMMGKLRAGKLGPKVFARLASETGKRDLEVLNLLEQRAKEEGGRKGLENLKELRKVVHFTPAEVWNLTRPRGEKENAWVDKAGARREIELAASGLGIPAKVKARQFYRGLLMMAIAGSKPVDLRTRLTRLGMPQKEVEKFTAAALAHAHRIKRKYQQGSKR